MLMLLAAVTLAAAPERPRVYVLDHDPRPPVACKGNGAVEVKTDPALLYRKDGKAKVAPLADLPKANHEKAVLRSVEGCARPMVVEYGAGR